MNRPATITHRLLAACLLAVFCWITGVKLFHTHHPDRFVLIPGGEQLEQDPGCVICDYHIAQDADATQALQPALHQCWFQQESALYRGHFTSSIGLAYSDRGPPAIFS